MRVNGFIFIIYVARIMGKYPMIRIGVLAGSKEVKKGGLQ